VLLVWAAMPETRENETVPQAEGVPEAR
jgi:hypothetical protein